jgi:chemotaxis protein methyltransferase CheR
MRPHEFEQIRKLAYDKFGLDLKSGKEELVAARLSRKVREQNLSSFQEYYRHVIADDTGEALIGMIDALATNHTSFFREPMHFEFLRKVIAPELERRGRADVWSAACSSGEEPYSIVFCLLECLRGAPIRVLATDISTRVLSFAQRGMYPMERMDRDSLQQVRSRLMRGTGRSADWFRIKPEVRDLVEFRRLNLIEPLPTIGPFYVIFCRNVMIYFDKPTQEKVVNQLCTKLDPGGYLLVGHSESLTGVRHPLQYVKPAIYRKPLERGRS